MPFRSNKPARLEKRTNGLASKDDNEHPDPRSPKRQSVQQLTHQQLVTRQRQLLSQQKQDQAAGKQSSDRALSPSTSVQCITGSLAAKASSTSVNTIVNTIESRIERVDVEKAIELLQELKKSASPEELVALHRALLPVKEEKPTQAPQLPPIEELAYTAAPQDRTRSSIPPGLATRNGVSNDPLRRPSETTSSKLSAEREHDWFFDFDNRRTQASASHERNNTISDQTSYHAGAFHSGTLRVTNGAASPEPSIISKLATDRDDREKLATEADDKEDALENEVTSSPQKKSSPLRKRMTMAVLGPRKLPDDQATKHAKKRTTIADRPRQLEQVSAPVLPRLDFAQSTDDLDVLSSGRRSSMGDVDSKSSRGYLLPTLGSADFSKDLEAPQVVEPRAHSFDFGPRSHIRKDSQLDPPLEPQSFQHLPTEASEEVPRFQQRWGHRASHLSGQRHNDSSLASSPRDKSGLLEFATRLSTVCDEDEEQVDQDTCMSHADTLSRLTGINVEADQTQHLAAGGSSDEANVDQSAYAQRLKTVRKKDSGYCSDATTPPQPPVGTCPQEQHSGANTTATGSELPPQREESPPTVALSADTSVNKSSSEADTEPDSSFTFEEILHPVQRSETVLGPSPQSDSKKSTRSLFKSKSSRKQSFNVLNVQKGAAPAEDTSKNSTTQTSSDGSRSPLNHKKSKKLQKPIPDAVRHQRKKTLENAKSSPVLQYESSDASCEQSPTPGGFNAPQRRLSVVDDGEDSKSLFSRKRGRSFSRKRSKTAMGDTNKDTALLSSRTTTPAPSSPAPSPKWSRSRSKTLTDANKDRALPSPWAMTPAPSSPSPSMDWSRRRSKSVFNIATVSAPAIEPSDPHMDASSCPTPAAADGVTSAERDEPMTVPGDGGQASEALTSHSPHALEAKRSADAPKGLHKRYYSVHRASADGATFATPANPTEAGNDAEAKAEDGESAADTEPAPVTPQMVKDCGEASTSVAVGSNCSVEDRFPDWHGRPAVNRASTTPSLLQPLFSAHARESSVPALPELPADIAAKVARADEMVAKKMKSSPRPSPAGSARSSIDHVDGKKSSSIKKRSSARDNARQAALDKLTASYDRKFDEQKADLSVKELMLNKPRGHVSRRSVDGSIVMPHPGEHAEPASPAHDSQHPGWPGWEKQSNLWRQRREARADPVSLDEQMSPTARTAPSCEPCDSPAIVVSRYITPLSPENVQNKRNSAIEYAQEYSNLIVNDQENAAPKPNICRADSAFSNVGSTMCVTMASGSDDDERPAKLDITRPGTAGSSRSTKTTTTTTTASSTSWEHSNSSATSSSISNSVRHERTKSGRYKAYRPTDAARAERSRALSVARQSTYFSSSESLGIPQQKQARPEDLIDRFGGGLGYAWDRDAGLGGSAGTVKRSSNDNANRKSIKMSEEFGLDLSDVPVFLQKMPKA